MKHDLKDAADGRKVLEIAAGWAEVAAEYDNVLAEFGNAAVPGFRPGRAPRAVVERFLGRQIRNAFAARSGRQLVREALRERNMRAAGPIALGDIQLDPRSTFSFTAEFIPAPRLDLPDCAALPLAGASDAERRDEASEWLLAHTPGEVPPALVRQECERAGEPGAGPGCEAWLAAARRVKLGLILEQVAEAEGIDADRRDVDARIRTVAAEHGMRPDELRRKLEREDGMDRLRSLLRSEQTLDYLLSRAGGRSQIDPDSGPGPDGNRREQGLLHS